MRTDGADHVARRQPLGLQLLDVQVHLNLPLLAAVRQRDRGALDRRQLRPDEVEPEIEELLKNTERMQTLAGELGNPDGKGGDGQ